MDMVEDRDEMAALNRADAALYRAKRGGRNAVVLGVADSIAKIPETMQSRMTSPPG